MNRRLLLLLVPLAFAAGITKPARAQAPIFRAYLSAKGDDANPCTRAAPCRLLPAAFAKVETGGEVWILDSANYNTGAVTLDRDVTVTAMPGALGSFVALGGRPAIIASGQATVALRNLTVLPFKPNPGFQGIAALDAKELVLDRIDASGFVDGTAVQVTGATRVSVTHGTFFDNRSAIVGLNGADIWVSDSNFFQNTDASVLARDLTGSGVRVRVARSVSKGSATAFSVTADGPTSRASLSVSDCQLFGQWRPSAQIEGSGLEAIALNDGTLVMDLAGNSVSNFKVGLLLQPSAASTGSFEGNHVAMNGTGLRITGGGASLSRGDNLIRDNGVDVETAPPRVGGQ